MREKHFQQKLTVVVLCAFLAMNYPLLLLASHNGLIFGFPPLAVYLFGVWALLILLVRRLTMHHQNPANSSNRLNNNAKQ